MLGIRNNMSLDSLALFTMQQRGNAALQPKWRVAKVVRLRGFKLHIQQQQDGCRVTVPPGLTPYGISNQPPIAKPCLTFYWVEDDFVWLGVYFPPTQRQDLSLPAC